MLLIRPFGSTSSSMAIRNRQASRTPDATAGVGQERELVECPKMRVTGVLVAAFVGAALMTTGCGRQLDDAKVATTGSEVSLSEEQQAAVRAGRALTKDRSAASVVMTVIEDLRDGAGPALFPVYDSRIPDRVGRGNVLGALQAMSGIIAGAQPVVARRRKTTGGELVVVRLLRTEGSDSKYSFLLRRNGQRWKIIYDSLLAQGLQSYVTNRESGGSGTPSPAATRAAARAVTKLQLATLYQAPRAGRPASARPAEQTPPAGSATTTTPPAGTGTTPGQ